MRPILADRLFVLWIVAALTLWCGMLAILWAEGFDPSGTSLPATLAALMLAIRAASGLPARAARGIQWLLAAMRLQESLAMELARAQSVPTGRRGVRAMMRLLAAGAVFAVIGGLISTAIVYLVSTPAEPDARGLFLWGPTAWALIKLGIQFLALLPMALGLSVTFLVTALVRGGSGLLYTRGSVPFFETYPGLYVPRALQIEMEFCEQSPDMLCREVLALTKMNWNSTEFDMRDPVTMHAARRVGDIMKYVPLEAPAEQIARRYSFYM